MCENRITGFNFIQDILWGEELMVKTVVCHLGGGGGGIPGLPSE